MELNDFKTWISVGTGLIAIGTAIYAFLTRGSKQNAERLEKVETRLSIVQSENVDIKHRVDKWREHMLALPDKDDFHSVEMTVASMAGDIKVLSGLVSQVSHKVDTIDAYLLEEKRSTR